MKRRSRFFVPLVPRLKAPLLVLPEKFQPANRSDLVRYVFHFATQLYLLERWQETRKVPKVFTFPVGIGGYHSYQRRMVEVFTTSDARYAMQILAMENIFGASVRELLPETEEREGWWAKGWGWIGGGFSLIRRTLVDWRSTQAVGYNHRLTRAQLAPVMPIVENGEVNLEQIEGRFSETVHHLFNRSFIAESIIYKLRGLIVVSALTIVGQSAHYLYHHWRRERFLLQLQMEAMLETLVTVYPSESQIDEDTAIFISRYEQKIQDLLDELEETALDTRIDEIENEIRTYQRYIRDWKNQLDR